MIRRPLRPAALPFALALLAGCADNGVVEIPDAGGSDVPAADVGKDVGVDVGVDVVGDRGNPRCTTNDDCEDSLSGPICDTVAGRCTGCRPTLDTCPPGEFCDPSTNRCLAGCRTDEACSGGRHCDTTTRTCVQCVNDAHCSSGTLCVGNLCVTGCSAERGCPGMQLCCSGACVDTVSNLANCGACDRRCTVPNAAPACLNSTCAVGSCMAPYGDCDRMAENGCEANTFTDVFHCGACGRACEARPHATSACAAGSCGYTCEAGWGDCDGNPANGCETDTAGNLANCGACNAQCAPPRATSACVMGRCTVTACSEGYANCDDSAVNGCEVELASSTTNCGTCGRVCPTRPNAVAACLARSCLTSCAVGFLDCDGMEATGCETEVGTSLANCGACGRACAPANAAAVCAAGRCSYSACNDSYVDLDGNTDNGCECHRTAVDAPDDGFVDANCDGIDGDAARAIFVAPSGNDGNPGTRAAPKRTIQAGITAAQAAGFAVYVAGGTYAESITLASGVSVYGGFNESGWTRGPSNVTTLQGGTTAVIGTGLGMAVELQRLTIVAASASAASGSSYGVRVVGSSGGVTLRSCVITAGNGVPGVDGVAGVAGAAGGNGVGLAAGSSACGTPGGAGGAGVRSDNAGLPGTAGNPRLTSPTDNYGGVGGTRGGCPNRRAGNGQDGGAGASGDNGALGSGGTPSVRAGDGEWIVSNGGSGTAGTNSRSGGGGGGGGGGDTTGFLCGDDNTGGNGGGGGGGGCLGTEGTGGTGGGGSFAVLAYTSALRVENCQLRAGNGGRGGNGGNGGNGGAAGVGAAGLAGNHSETGTGGRGGNGGAGGSGGGGGGGSGGPSVCVYYVGAVPTQVGSSCARGTAGTGGAGGTSNVGAAPSGTPGVGLDTYGG